MSSRVLTQAWLVFAVTAVVAGLLWALVEPSNLLRSDDAYIVGFCFGVLAAAMAAIYSVAEKLLRTRARACLCYFLIVWVWSGFLLIAAFGGGEGAEVFLFAAWTSLLVAIWVLPFITLKPGRRFVSAASAAVAVGFVFYVKWMIGHEQ